MKVLLVIPSFYPAIVYGGPIFSTLHTCEELAKFKGIEVFVTTTNSNLIKPLDVENNQWICLRNFSIKYYKETILDKFSLSLFVNVWFDIEKCDVVHVQSLFSISSPWSMFCARKLNKPIIFSPRGAMGRWCLNNGSRLKKLWLKLLIKPFANDIIWHATAEQEKLEIQAIYPGAKVEIIPNGINLEEYRHPNHEKWHYKKYLPQNVKFNKVIVSMGRIQKKKGFDILINSIRKLRDKNIDVGLLIAGPDEGEKVNLVNLINKLDLQNNVFFVGTLEAQEKIDFLANADVFALPSHNENFGNVYIESLAVGTPVVASLDTPWQIVEEYKCGKWVSNNAEKTSAAIEQLFSEDKGKLRLNALKLAKLYDWSNVAFQFKNLFIKLV